MLRPEYKGQPVCTHVISTGPFLLTTTVTSGVVALNVGINGSDIPSFTTRFLGYSEYRIVKARARVNSFGSNLTGLVNHWFSEDDSTAPTVNKAEQAKARRFPICDIRSNEIDYVPHDPAQQTWTLVSSGTPIIGYYKLYTDAANYGAPITAVNIGLLDLELTVQFRGFI